MHSLYSWDRQKMKNARDHCSISLTNFQSSFMWYVDEGTDTFEN